MPVGVFIGSYTLPTQFWVGFTHHYQTTCSLRFYQFRPRPRLPTFLACRFAAQPLRRCLLPLWVPVTYPLLPAFYYVWFGLTIGCLRTASSLPRCCYICPLWRFELPTCRCGNASPTPATPTQPPLPSTFHPITQTYRYLYHPGGWNDFYDAAAAAFALVICLCRPDRRTHWLYYRFLPTYYLALPAAVTTIVAVV